MDWQPISTAPMDGAKIWLSAPDQETVKGRWRRDLRWKHGGYWWLHDNSRWGGGRSGHGPTRWKPIKNSAVSAKLPEAA